MLFGTNKMNDQLGKFGIQGSGISNPWGLNPMEQMEEQRKLMRIYGYLVGKQMALQMKQLKKQQEKVISPPIIQPDTGIISIQFKKGTSTINITMKSDEMVADLLNEYFVKSHTTNGKFNFNGNILLPTDVSSLSQVGLNNGSIIYVS